MEIGSDKNAPARDRLDREGLIEAVTQVGDRWVLLIVDALLAGPRRFGTLQEAIPGLAPNILSARLKHLERAGVLVARPYSTRPPRVSYELTAAGKSLADTLHLLAGWGAQSAAGRQRDARPRHGLCGSAMEIRWWCPTCEQSGEPDEPIEWV